MEVRPPRPLPELQVLPLDHDQETLEVPTSGGGTLTTPKATNGTAIVIQWQAAQLLSRMDQDALLKLVPRISGSFCEIDRIPIIKSYMNMLLLLHENDSDKQWIARIPYEQEDEEFLIDQVEPLMRVCKKFNTFRCPRLYHYGLAKDENNTLGIDYMLLDFIDGRQMPMWTESFPSFKQKRQVLEQIADAYMEMFSKPATYKDRIVLRNANRSEELSQQDFDVFDLPPTVTASSYLHRLADRAIETRVEMLASYDDLILKEKSEESLDRAVTDVLVLSMMRAIVPRYVLGRYNDSPFYITHPDLHNRNIVIEGLPVPEESLQSPPLQPRARGFTGTGDHPAIVRTATAYARGRALTEVSRSQKSDDLKIAGIIDWDGAHPVPLQTAAIMPKCLSTLPGAQFPDLPASYVEPDLQREKALFLDILSTKEQEQNGNTLVSDLIRNGSWERDFFTVALRRADVRRKWLEWWKEQQCAKMRGTRSNNFGYGYCWTQQDLENMRHGLYGFLTKIDQRCAMELPGVLSVIWWIVLELERLEGVAVEACWAELS